MEPMSKHAAYPGRFETKFLVPGRHALVLGEWLDHVCVPDPKHPCNRVNSLYYDTTKLDLCAAKESSDYLKAKIRVRWYGAHDVAERPVFIEVKMKKGAQVHKLRAELGEEAETWARPTVDHEVLQLLHARVRNMVPFRINMLAPVCVISYQRHRYIDPRTGWRVALDQDIRIPVSNSELFPFTREGFFDFAVFELKGRGPRPRLPAHLTPHQDVTVLPETFSKYYAGVETLKLTGLPL